ncbi:SAM-dependent methyltransferase [Catenulispora yoronensis]|uniref:SAM-dependent methyltransferase n=1 Tax=Catenulispora yoronensis TaxID=450799 RepID=A0ABN2U196_9ACTN
MIEHDLGGDFTPLPDWAPPEIDQSIPHPARIYNHLIGGKDNFAVDRAAAAAATKALPQAPAMAKANRAFLGRAVRYLAEQGLDQFLDIGAGIPGPGNTGEVARTVHPRARVAYIDYDPIVVTHTRALTADPALTAVAVADVREPKTILEHPEIRTTLDFDRPIAVLLVAVLHFLTPDEDLRSLVNQYTDAVPPGSALVISHITPGGDEARNAEARKAWATAKSQLVQRTEEEVTALFSGVDVVDPGVVQLQLWHPDASVDPNLRVLIHGGVGFKR